jgi:hypothetical protein
LPMRVGLGKHGFQLVAVAIKVLPHASPDSRQALPRPLPIRPPDGT